MTVSHRSVPTKSLILVRIAAAWLCAVCLFAQAQVAQAQDEEDAFGPGLLAEFKQGGRSFQRIDTDLACAWDATSGDQRLQPGRFAAHWQGYFKPEGSGEFVLSAYVQGKVEIRLADTLVLAGESAQPVWLVSAPLDVPNDWQPISIRYTRTADEGRLILCRQSPRFGLEPIPAKAWSHRRVSSEQDAGFARGRALVRARRCNACHDTPEEPAAIPGPALVHIRDTLRAEWLVDWLASTESRSRRSSGSVPHAVFSSQQARQIAAYLWEVAEEAPPPRHRFAAVPEKLRQTPSRERGEHLAWTLGCLACHEFDQQGDAGLFGGGPLDEVAGKRPEAFFRQWLADPQSLNPDHRMPRFELDEEEAADLSVYLQSRTPASGLTAVSVPTDGDSVRAGRRLFQDLNCGACHAVAADATATRRGPPDVAAGARRGCLAEQPEANVPPYRWTDIERTAVVAYLQGLAPDNPMTALRGPDLLEERRCLACHARDDAGGLGDVLKSIGETRPALADRIPAMTPPALTAVGDKLRDAALLQAVQRTGKPHRPYLDVRMPIFRFAEGEAETLVREFIHHDRIPAAHPQAVSPVELDATDVGVRVAGGRLVTTDGFGCTSCHDVGDVAPPATPLNARGPDLLMLGERVRRAWFDRWVRDPARIVPRMEMPSVKLPVRGTLDDQLDDQLAAVWAVLNRPDFRPPEPNPVRIVRQRGDRPAADRSVFVSDVIETSDRQWIKPLLIGLPNRHNILFDLEAGRLAGWTVGDVARQRTRGKTWYWELAGTPLVLDTTKTAPCEIVLSDGEREYTAVRGGQFVTEFDELIHRGPGLEMRYRLRFDIGDEQLMVRVQQTVQPFLETGKSGVEREIMVSGLPRDWTWRLDVPAPGVVSDGNGQWMAQVGSDVRILEITKQPFRGGPTSYRRWLYLYLGEPDRFLVESPPRDKLQPRQLRVVPGFETTRLPLADELMPTALAWNAAGELFVTSLKGRVWRVTDEDRDGLEDQMEPVSQELAAPFGLAAGNGFLDVINKYALLRCVDEDGDGRIDRYRTVASGWGHTADYHDWAIGLPVDGNGGYFLAFACQQDDRSRAASRYRGQVVHLIPREPNDDAPHLFRIKTVSRGHRFPIGIARSGTGDLFVTDNQGNYNPFNELNAVRDGAHFGFLNKLDRGGPRPAWSPPAIKIPHPWTRSVNGICFLDTPATARTTGRNFGPFEGHLVGCEYDTRRLVRMTLQQVEGEWQGAVYPFSYEQPLEGEPLLGPLACAVSPAGDLYVGCIRDSGWGGANNIGALVRLCPPSDGWPAGLAGMEATATGFRLEFTRPVLPALAEDLTRYAVESFTRESTPAYGGPDVARRHEPLERVEVAADGRSAQLYLALALRAGFVYELRLQSLVGDGEFFPAEAFYTLKRIPR